VYDKYVRIPKKDNKWLIILPTMHPHIRKLLKCIELEEKEESNRYKLDQQHSLKQLKKEGLALHPIIVTRKCFGYADYPDQYSLPGTDGRRARHGTAAAAQLFCVSTPAVQWRNPHG